MTTLEQFEKICQNIDRMPLAPNDLRSGGDVNKPRVRAELDKLDIHETEDGLGDYMLGIMFRWYYDYPDQATGDHLKLALKYFEQAKAKGYAAAGEEIERIVREESEKAAREAEWKRVQEEHRRIWKTDNPLFPLKQEFKKKPADDWKIEKMRTECIEKFGVEPPDGYVSFLKAKDGFESQSREIFEAHRAGDNKPVYDLNPTHGGYWIVKQASMEKRYFFVGRSGGGCSEWSVEQNQYVHLPWEKYYAYDYEIRRYVRANAETGDIEQSYATFAEMFKAIWAGIITEGDYMEKLPEVDAWRI